MRTAMMWMCFFSFIFFVVFPTCSGYDQTVTSPNSASGVLPNVFVVGVGHSGTTVLTKMCFLVGLNGRYQDSKLRQNKQYIGLMKKFNEDVELLQLDKQIVDHYGLVFQTSKRTKHHAFGPWLEAMKNGKQPNIPWKVPIDNNILSAEMAGVLTAHKEPWVMKDPRLVFTLEAWTKVAHAKTPSKSKPFALFLTRRWGSLYKSYTTRNEWKPTIGPCMALWKDQWFWDQYHQYDGPKLVLQFELVSASILSAKQQSANGAVDFRSLPFDLDASHNTKAPEYSCLGNLPNVTDVRAQNKKDSSLRNMIFVGTDSPSRRSENQMVVNLLSAAGYVTINANDYTVLQESDCSGAYIDEHHPTALIYLCSDGSTHCTLPAQVEECVRDNTIIASAHPNFTKNRVGPPQNSSTVFDLEYPGLSDVLKEFDRAGSKNCISCGHT